MPITCKFTPTQGGSEFEVKNIIGVSWGVSRQPGVNGHVGMAYHEIGTIVISRHRSLQEGNTAQLEPEIVKLAAATEKKAYFSGEITVAQPDDLTNIVQTVRWETGHICGLSSNISEDQITESLVVSVTGLQVGDEQFKRRTTS